MSLETFISHNSAVMYRPIYIMIFVGVKALCVCNTFALIRGKTLDLCLFKKERFKNIQYYK